MGFFDRFKSRRDSAEVRTDGAYARALASAQTGIGFPGGPDSAAGVRPVQMRKLNDEELANLFRSSPFARRIILEPAADATRAGWRIVGEGLDSQAMTVAHDALHAKDRFFHSDWLSELKGGAGTILLTREIGGEDLSQPLKEDSLLEVRGLIVASREELVPQHPFSWDLEKPDLLGKPELYRWQPLYGGATGETIHASRIIRWDGVPTDPRHAHDTDGWGCDSRLQAVWEQLRDYQSASASVSKIVETFTQTVLKVQGLAEMLSRSAVAGDLSGQQEIHERITALGKLLHNLRIMVIDADGESLEKLGSPVGGLSELLQILSVNLCAASNMAASKLFGIAPPGLSTDDLSGARNYELTVQARQATRYEPAIRRLTKLIMLSKAGPTGGELVDFEVLFNPLSEPTELERAQIDKTRAEAIGIVHDLGGIIGPEIRQGLFDGAKEFAGISIDVSKPPAKPLPAPLPRPTNGAGNGAPALPPSPGLPPAAA